MSGKAPLKRIPLFQVRFNGFMRISPKALPPVIDCEDGSAHFYLAKLLWNGTEPEVASFSMDWKSSKNVLAAARLYAASALRGHVGGCRILGLCYEMGIGVDQDSKLASYWLEKSTGTLTDEDTSAITNALEFWRKGRGEDSLSRPRSILIGTCENTRTESPARVYTVNAAPISIGIGSNESPLSSSITTEQPTIQNPPSRPIVRHIYSDPTSIWPVIVCIFVLALFLFVFFGVMLIWWEEMIIFGHVIKSTWSQ